MKKKFVGMTVLFAAVICLILSIRPVNVKAAKIKLNKTEASLEVGDKVKLKVKNTSKKIKWKSDNKAVATVTQRGNVVGVSAGECTITAKVGKKTLKCKVNVKDTVLEALDSSVTVSGVELLKSSKWDFEGENKSKNIYQYSLSKDTFRWIWVEIIPLTEEESEELRSSEEKFTAACNIIMRDSFEEKYEIKDDSMELITTDNGFIGKEALTCLSYGNEISTRLYTKVEGNNLVVTMSMEIEPDPFTEKLVYRICAEAKEKKSKENDK